MEGLLRSKSMIIVRCQFCGKKFKIYPYRLRKERGKYCSNECKYKGIQKKKISKVCSECGKNYKIYPSEERRRDRKFCSPRCRGNWMKRTQLGFGGSHSYNQIKKNCEICGKEFKSKNYDKDTHRYCSNRCRGIGHSELMKKKYHDSDYIKKLLKSLKIHPNKKEQILDKILHRLFPSEYKFVGDFSFVLGGRSPDFMNVNGQKKLIEFYGDYWHDSDRFPSTQTSDERIKYFKKYGFETLIIWESELKDTQKLEKKIKVFHHE